MAIITNLYGRIPSTSVFSGENRLARFLARRILQDMAITAREKLPRANPFVQYERHFGQSSLHMGRFQNFIAEKGILRDLLAVNWFKDIGAQDRIPVIALFEKVLHSENVQRSIQNRPQFFQNAQYIEDISYAEPTVETFSDADVSIDDHDISDLIEGPFGAEFDVVEVDFDFPADEEALTAVSSGDKPLRYVNTETSDKTTKLIDEAFEYLGGTMPSGFETKLLTAISKSASAKANPMDLPRLLSAFELCFGESSDGVAKLSETLNKLLRSRRPNLSWLDSINFNDRVLVSSLFRRIGSMDARASKWLRDAKITDKISVGTQEGVAQLVEPNAIELEERALFGKILTGALNRGDHVLTKKFTSVKSMTSERALKLSGWYKFVGGKDWTVSEAIRTRCYADVMAIAHDPKAMEALSPQIRNQVIAFGAYIGQPVPRHVTKMFSDIPMGLAAVQIQNASAVKLNAERALFSREMKAPYESPRGLWFALQSCALNDLDVAFQEVLGRLGGVYGKLKPNAINDRLVSFDTFMMTDVSSVLEAASRLEQWALLPTQAMMALAYCAINTGQTQIFASIVDELKTRNDMSRNLFVPMMQTYQLRGFHNVDSLLANTGHKNIEIKPSLARFGAEDRVLALIEGPASLRSLRNIQGQPAELHCVPVQPVQVTKLPDFATVTQVDDVIPTYGEEDARLGAQVDKIVTDYIDGAKELFRKAGFDKLLVESIEAAHANLFFPAYRDLLNLHIAQQFVQQADEYDHVIVIMNNGLSYGPLVKDLVEKVGKSRVHVTIQNERRDVSLSALNEIRRNYDLPALGRKRAHDSNWAPNLRKWLTKARTTYLSEPMSVNDTPYALACFEHINGYGDSYKALVNENLKHGDVELRISVANKELQTFINEDGFAAAPEDETSDYWGELRQFSALARPEATTEWLPGLLKVAEGVLNDSESPLFPERRHMFARNITAFFGQRLPLIFDALAYFTIRFDKQAPTHVMTGPNQHMFSRVASYVAKNRGVRVYDFLILANTDHPRYRPPVADIAYLYDDWYNDIYRDFFKFDTAQLRQSGPLFRYADRLKTDMTGYEKTKGLQDVVLFSQSANFENTRTMLEAICEVIADREDIALTVKLHPHESPGNVARFTEIANANGVKDNLTVIHKGNAVALVNKADLVVQSFSNIGLDAFLLGKPVITYKPSTNLTSRIFLYEKEIGLEVRDPKSLVEALKGQFDSPAARKKMSAKAKAFAKENAHFLRTDNARRVVDEIHNDLSLAKS